MRKRGVHAIFRFYAVYVFAMLQVYLSVFSCDPVVRPSFEGLSPLGSLISLV